MTETAQEYESRFAAYTEGKDPIAMQREALRSLAQLIEGVLENGCSSGRRPASGR
jgi:hypothetical protein